MWIEENISDSKTFGKPRKVGLEKRAFQKKKVWKGQIGHLIGRFQGKKKLFFKKGYWIGMVWPKLSQRKKA